jgi:Zn-dependent M28 family amino/carboxypeptidase
MRSFLLAAAGALSVVGCAPDRSEFDGANALGQVEAQIEMGARYPGSPGHGEIQRWIESGLISLGWETVSTSFPYRDETLTNISARQSESSGPLIVLGAHYDTRRLADRDTRRPDLPVPGANDGGSGVAVLLELARILPQRDLACDVQLAFFDGEDNGRLDDWQWAVGSRHYAQSLEREPMAVVVVDMVGDRDLRLPIERTSTPDLAQEIWEAASQAGLEAFRSEPGPSVLDDHTAFLERGWRAVDIIDLTYPPWHTTEDTLDKISAESLDQVGEALLAWLGTVCGDR